MSRQVNALPRPRAHGGARRRHRPRDARSRPVVEPLVRTLERIHQDKQRRRSRSTCPPDARFQGERQDLEEMLGNLLDNACKWARRKVSLT